LLLTDEYRRLLAVKGKSLGRKALMELTSIVTPDTILRWHRTLVAQKWDHADGQSRNPGRPGIRQVVDLILRFARENPSWSYDRIQGALANVGYHISDTTVGNVLKQHGIQPAPGRKRRTTWSTFLKAHCDVLAAIDFTTACSSTLGDSFMTQVARNLTDSFDGFLKDKRFVVMDRDAHFSAAFRTILKDAGVTPLRLPPKSPNLNAHLERFHLFIKTECLDRMIFFGEQSLRNAVRQYLIHYHRERNHQGLDNTIIESRAEISQDVGDIHQCQERLGGMLRYYYRAAA
jgi:transposase InsO family protein